MKPLKPITLIVLLCAVFCQVALAQTPAKPTAKATATPTPAAVAAPSDPLALEETEALNLDRNQQQGAVLKEEETQVRKNIAAAADKILAAKNADAMSAAGYQMRDALSEDIAYRNKANTHQQATEALVAGIRARYQQQTGLDCSQCTINVQTKRLQPLQSVTQGNTATSPEQRPGPKTKP